MRKFMRFAGIALILAGVLLGGLRISQDRRQTHEYSQAQGEMRRQLSQVVRKEPRPREGEPVAVLRIPKFGAGYRPVVVEGVSQQDLAKGPGHYTGSAMPGQIGNFAVAGHRTGWGQPFNRLGELKPGDSIVVEWRGRDLTYRVTGTERVKRTQVGVVLPVPDRPGVKPDKALITLTTCTDRDPVSRRYRLVLVVRGELSAR
ncbi:class E sortase [Streptomyces gilvus]|uniref:class E sortase n=1 Tax=Streptomyces gilvus TaxID=2920937 RepID=UPI001F0FBA58|nr:class E sortase [Streptomyces sp. CME 23]MCH5670792.1 class E sortase [Streptomyces sp. CME 23]